MLLRHQRRQFAAGLQIGNKSMQITVVDADQQRFGKPLQLQHALDFGFIVHFQQHIHFQLACMQKQLLQSAVAERCGNQQNGIGTDCARLDDLVMIDDEVLAQNRQIAGLAGKSQVAIPALKKVLIGEHGKTRRPA